MDFQHTSVMLRECIDGLELKQNGTYVDCTLGGAGHSFEIIRRIYPDGRLIGIDQDLDALAAAKNKLKPFIDRVELVHSNFQHVGQIVREYAPEGVDGILFDLGVSSYQLDTAERGFSYMHDAELDMRMNRAEQQLTAKEIVNTWPEQDISKIIWEYGDERWAKRIAQFIVEERKQLEITSTGQLVQIIKKAIPKGARKEGPHPAKRTFQALRIAVNDELKRFERALREAVEVLKPGGRVVIISFHSLEDKIAKKVLQELARSCVCPPELPVCMCKQQRKIKVVTGKPLLPSQEEIECNPRARSAKVRIGLRV